jgi:UrcA family protein
MYVGRQTITHSRVALGEHNEVKFMKTLSKTHSIRNILVVVAVSAVMLPVFALASTPKIGITYDAAELESTQGQERLYQRLQQAAHKLCGSTDLHVTGKLAGKVANEECYEGTLTAAVERLDKPAITALHTTP